MRRALAILILAALAGCSTRERSNPLDPHNTTTGGKPAGFVAEAQNGQIFLTWSAAISPQGLEFQLYRQVEGQPDFTPLTQILPGTTTDYLDLGLTNGVTYRYRLYFVVAREISGAPAEDAATPSPVIPWVVDIDRGSLIRLTADGRQIAVEQPGFAGPTDCKVDRSTHLVWVADPGDGRVFIYSPALASGTSVRGLGDPSFIAVDPGLGSAWISAVQNDEVIHLLNSGFFGTPPSVGPIDAPLGLDVDPKNHEVWVCERRGNSVRHFSQSGVPVSTTFLSTPSRVAIDTTSGDAWVTSFESRQLFHLNVIGTPIDTISSFQGPVGVAVDETRGRVWVADPVAGQVIAFRRNGTEEFRVSGLPGARELAVEDLTGEAWVVMNATIARVSSTGTPVLFARGLQNPVAITIDRFGP
jgi:DNA-binding beta-propeller fold protein YncE